MKRRTFVTAIAVAAAVHSGLPRMASASFASPKIGLGMDNFAIRDMGLKAAGLIDYANSLKLDALFISDLDAFESLDDAYLRDIRKKSNDLGISMYVGGWSICPTSKSFRTNRGTAEEHLRLGLRVAKTLGSPVFRVILGNAADRKTEGGIQARIADTVTVLKACRAQALDLGVKVAIENHAGDMHSWELAQLIETAGTDYVGANFDSGNAAFTLEDPHDAFENLGKHTICSSLRDNMVWETPEGATVQWTAAGEGLIDWRKFATRWAELCPTVPIMIETIYGRRDFPFKSDDFWQSYDKRPKALDGFKSLAKRGHPIEARKPSGPNPNKEEGIEYQKSELLRSISFLRDKIGLGLKS